MQKKIRGFKDLDAWQKAMDLAVMVYRGTKGLPATERYGLTSQMRRAAVSIPSNIAEGQRRGTNPAFVSHLRIALGSQGEFETQILLSERLGFIDQKEAQILIKATERSGQLLNGLLRSLRK